MITRVEAREMFEEAGLTYQDLTTETVRKLRTRLNTALIEAKLFKDSLRCHQRAEWFEGGVAIKCHAHYFYRREAVTFNPDGFVGFAGWASDENVQPILHGFVEWVKDISEAKPKPHRYRPMTMRDGSKACADCYAPPNHPVHQ